MASETYLAITPLTMLKRFRKRGAPTGAALTIDSSTNTGSASNPPGVPSQELEDERAFGLKLVTEGEDPIIE